MTYWVTSENTVVPSVGTKAKITYNKRNKTIINNKAPRRTLLFGSFASFVIMVTAERPHIVALKLSPWFMATKLLAVKCKEISVFHCQFCSFEAKNVGHKEKCRLQISRVIFPQNRFSVAQESHKCGACEPHTPVGHVWWEKKTDCFPYNEIILTRGACYCLLQALASHLVVIDVFSNSKAVLSNVSPCINWDQAQF